LLATILLPRLPAGAGDADPAELERARGAEGRRPGHGARRGMVVAPAVRSLGARGEE